MRRFAQYIDAEDGTPGQADNADNLDGNNSNVYRGIANGTAPKSLTAPIGTVDVIPLLAGPQKLLQHSLTAPSSGTVFIAYNATIQIGASLDGIAPIMWVQIDDTTCNNLAATWQQGIEPGTLSVSEVAPPLDPIGWSSQGASAVRPLPAGSHTFTLCHFANTGSSGGEVRDISLSALFFGEGSANVAEITGSSAVGDGLPLGESG